MKIEEALERAADLEKFYMSLPSDNDVMTGRQQETVHAVRCLAIHRRGMLLNDLNMVKRLSPKADETLKFRDTLVAAQTSLQADLTGEQASADRSDEHFRRIEEWKLGLKTVRLGPPYIGGSFETSVPLMEFLRAAGYAEVNPFSGRGGLVTTEERLGIFRRALDEVESRIERELATPLPTLELPAAKSLG